MSAPRSVSLAFQSDKPLAAYARLGALAERYGFDGVSVFNDLGYQPPLPALLAIAAETSRIRLGPACLNPYLLHPLEIAGQIATLDAASGGRAYLGLARGAWLDRVGVAQHRPLRTLKEAVAVVSALLRGDDSGFDGEVFQVAPGTALRYRPHRERVDVLLGLWGPRGARMAATCADEVKLGGCANPDMVRLMRGWLAAGAAEAGRDRAAVGVVAGAVTVVDHDRAVARRRARAEVAMYLDVVAALDPTVKVPDDVLAGLRQRLAAGDHDAAGALIGDDLLDRFAFAGSPDDVAAQAWRLFEAGASRVEFGTPHGSTDVAGVELLGGRVLPQLRS